MRRIIIIILSMLILGLQKIVCFGDCRSTQDGIHHTSVAYHVDCRHNCYTDRYSKMEDGYCTGCGHTRDARPPIIVNVTEEDLHRKPEEKETSLFAIDRK